MPQYPGSRASTAGDRRVRRRHPIRRHRQRHRPRSGPHYGGVGHHAIAAWMMAMMIWSGMTAVESLGRDRSE